jgi:hypothetical protein
MKKHHVLIILLLAGIAVFFLNETRNLRSDEAIVGEELKMLREAVRKSPGASSTRAETNSSSRPPVIDPTKFIADFTTLLNSSSDNNGQNKAAFQKEYEAQLHSAPLPKLKEICLLLEKNFTFDQVDSESYRIWLYIVGLTAQSDPLWAFAKYDEATSTNKVGVHAALITFKQWASRNGESMNPSFAEALRRWLDAAQGEGRMDEGDPLVAELRAGIAAAQGNPSDAARQISLLPYSSQKKAAIKYVAGLLSPEAQRQAMKDFSTTLDAQNFPDFVRELANQQGFEATQKILESASLLPEKHDMAAAGIAAANIGPETKDRAAWLLENLKTDGYRALEEFTETWTEKNHTDAAQWITTLQPGPKRDAALKGFIPAAARVDGATSMDWALTVSDPILRNQMYSESFVKWTETDPEQANIYRNTHPLDHEALDAGSK